MTTHSTASLGVPHEAMEQAPYDVVGAHAPVDMDGRRDLTGYARNVVYAALEETGVDLGAYDRRIADWLGGFDAVSAVAVASWLVRAHEAGQASGKR